MIEEIHDALRRLPEDVQQLAYERILFAGANADALAITFPPNPGGLTIILNPAAFDLAESGKRGEFVHPIAR